MREIYSSFYPLILFSLLALSTTSTELKAQLMIERELVGAVAASSTTTGSDEDLKVDDSFGEPMIGYVKGDIIVTIGFQQPGSSVTGNNFVNRQQQESEEEQEEFNISAYPNPTIEKLTVDLGSYQNNFTELQLIDAYGRIVKSRKITDESVVTIPQLDNLPNSNYFLYGMDKKGKIHHLATVMVINQQR